MRKENTPVNLVHMQPDVHVLKWRFFALLIDMICFSLLMGVIDAVFGVVQVTSGTLPPPPSAGIGGFSTYIYTAVPQVQWPGGHLLWSWLVMEVYFLGQEMLFGTTLGKRAMGLRVVGLNGERLSLKAALIRNVLRFVDSLPWILFTITLGPFGIPVPYIVGAIVLWGSPLRQRVGDHLARTLVVRTKTAPQAAIPSGQVLPRLFCVIAPLLIFLACCANFDYYGRPPLVVAGWKNTHTGFFSDGREISYSLGVPQWGDGTVSYSIQFVTNDGHDCSGEFTMRWSNWIDGWEMDRGQSSCS